MDYNTLLDMATDLGYELAMSGAETFRVEESISRILASYGVEAEVFAIPNYLIVSIQGEDGHPITRMRRIGQHGNDLDSVEKFSGLSRALCNRKPEPVEGLRWLEHVRGLRVRHNFPTLMAGYFAGGFGYSLFFGGTVMEAIWGGLCGILIGLIDRVMATFKANVFFRTITEAFLMALVAYAVGAGNIVANPDTVIIGALMILVPGLLFTNAMRDIIYGDTNSGINRIVQVLLIAVAIALGTACAWQIASFLWGAPVSGQSIPYNSLLLCLFSFIGCMGFAIQFNIHGPGILLCALGGTLSCLVYEMVFHNFGNDIPAYFWGALFASVYSEIMARLRKYPAISYLVVSIFPMIPGAGVYYTMNYAVRGQMEAFAEQGMHTAAIAGIMAVGILLGSTVFRAYSVWKNKR